MAFQNRGNFIPTTQSWDVTELYQTDINSPKFKELLVRMYQNLNLMAEGVNSKTSGMYNANEVASGDTFFPSAGASSTTDIRAVSRPVFRRVLNVGALVNGTKTIPHGLGAPITGIPNTWTLTRLYGAATDPTSIIMVPIPYASATPADNIELYMDATNVYIISGAIWTSYTKCFVIIEYLKN